MKRLLSLFRRTPEHLRNLVDGGVGAPLSGQDINPGPLQTAKDAAREQWHSERTQAGHSASALFALVDAANAVRAERINDVRHRCGLPPLPPPTPVPSSGRTGTA